jgi:hypothetical protein
VLGAWHGLTDPSDANIDCGSGADEIDQETANITVDAISNSESDKGYRDCEEPDRDNQHPSAGGRYARLGEAKRPIDRHAMAESRTEGALGPTIRDQPPSRRPKTPTVRKAAPQRRFLLSVVFKVMPFHA